MSRQWGETVTSVWTPAPLKRSVLAATTSARYSSWPTVRIDSPQHRPSRGVPNLPPRATRPDRLAAARLVAADPELHAGSPEERHQAPRDPLAPAIVGARAPDVEQRLIPAGEGREAEPLGPRLALGRRLVPRVAVPVDRPQHAPQPLPHPCPVPL